MSGTASEPLHALASSEFTESEFMTSSSLRYQGHVLVNDAHTCHADMALTLPGSAGCLRERERETARDGGGKKNWHWAKVERHVHLQSVCSEGSFTTEQDFGRACARRVLGAPRKVRQGSEGLTKELTANVEDKLQE